MLLKGGSLTSVQMVLLGAHIPSRQAMDIVHEYLAREGLKSLILSWKWERREREPRREVKRHEKRIKHRLAVEE